MLAFQLEAYDNAVEMQGDALDRKSGAVANFVFPGLSDDKSSIVGYYGKAGMNVVKSQLRNYNKLLLERINEKFLDNKINNLSSILYEVEKTKNLSGTIFKLQYLKYFSIKFYTALSNINELVSGKKNPGTAFIYSNLVTVGIDLFKEILMQNGYLEYNEEGTGYTITDDTICYYCGKTSKEHKSVKPSDKDWLDFSPATFVTITGKSEETADVIPEVKKKLLDNVFNNIENKEGKFIKLLLGSKVMNEGITLENVREVHILDVHYNLGKVHQAIGRAIRQCKHYKVTNDKNPFPTVSIYKYVVSLKNGLSSEEELYQKAELKYLLIKKTERALKEIAIDCPINYHGNIFPEETEKYKKCVPVEQTKNNKTKDMCPEICDFTDCEFICKDKKLNLDYYDKTRNIYKKISKNELDYTTFTNSLARDEIDYAKTKIKELYKFKYVYILEEIVSYIKNSYSGEKKELFDEFFVFKGLDELIPITENDFNNFKDTIYDKYSVPGYLIYRSKYYIFQPFNQNEDVPMYYRSTYNKELQNDLTLYNYLKNTDTYQTAIKNQPEAVGEEQEQLFGETSGYDFESVKDYYDNRDEFKYVGIIDKTSNRKKSITPQFDIFKIRPKREKILVKKRGTGIPSFKGAVCSTSKNRESLIKMAQLLGLNVKHIETRIEICNVIKNEMLFLEKYGTQKDKNKFTYMMIPKDHPVYEFPYNLEDRIDYIINNIKQETDSEISMTKKKEGNGIFDNKRSKDLVRYVLTIKDDKKHGKIFAKNGFKLNKGEWVRIVE